MKTLLTLILPSILAFTSCHFLAGIPDYVGYRIINGTPHYSGPDGVVGERFRPVPDADTKSFKILSSKYAKDKSNVYSGGQKISGADPQTFELLKYDYARDRNNLYWGPPKIRVDPRTVVVLRKDLIMDRGRVYHFHEHLNETSTYVQYWETIKSKSHLLQSSGKQRYVDLVQRERAKRGWTLLPD